LRGGPSLTMAPFASGLGTNKKAKYYKASSLRNIPQHGMSHIHNK